MAGIVKRHWKSFVWAASALALGFGLIFLSRNVAGFAGWYAVYVFPIFPNTIGRLLSPLPFSVYEFVLYALPAALLLFLIWLIVRAVRKKNIRQTAGKLFLFLLNAIPAVFLMLTLTCSINYGRTPFGQTAGYDLRNASAAELEALCVSLAEEVRQAALQIPTDEAGRLKVDQAELRSMTKSAMYRLGEQYPSLAGYYPNPKPVAFSKGMSHLRLTGMFSPYTIEANYNRDIPGYEIPYTICHELAHLKGYIREDEAGFIAYLACRESGNPAMQYSGALNALSYAMNAYYTAGSKERYFEIFEMLPQSAKADYQRSNDYWSQFETKAAEISTVVNDTYLKANDQSDGVQSYGRMVDLLLAERRSRD